MKTILYLTVLFLLPPAACNAQADVPTGFMPIEEIEKETWFSQGYQAYAPDHQQLAVLKDHLGDHHFLVFGGTWCGDTQMLLPRFYKAIDQAGISRKKVKLYLLDPDFNSPGNLEEEFEVRSLPAFLVLMGNEEAGRITASSPGTIEEEIAVILQPVKE